MTERTEAEGKAASSKVQASEAAHEIMEAAKDALADLQRAARERGYRWCDDTSGHIARHPLQTLAIAGLAGVVLGLLTRRRTCGCQFRGTEKNAFD